MKKIYLLLAATAVLGACSESDVIKEVVENEVAIGFNASFIDNSTKANAGEMITTTEKNTMNVDGNTMEVWGWKSYTSGSTTTNTQIFDQQVVTYNSSSSQTTTYWEYSPLKYWDKTSSYLFYASAPDGKFTLVENLNTPANRRFSAENIPAVQTLFNQDASSTTSLIKLADAADDVKGTASSAIDYLVSNVVSCDPGAATQGNAADKDVEFTFNHILSKLDVNVLTTSEFVHASTDANQYPQIKLTKLTLEFGKYTPATGSTSASWTNMWYDAADKYEFAQKTAGKLVPAGSTTGTADDWTITNTDGTAPTEIISFCSDESGTVTAANANVPKLSLTAEAQGVASYFLAPTDQKQLVKTSGSEVLNQVYVTAEYDIIYANGTGTLTEHCVSEKTEVLKVKTAATGSTPAVYEPALPEFIQNSYYKLNVTIGPRAIYFDVKSVAGWTDGGTGTVTVE